MYRNIIYRIPLALFVVCACLSLHAQTKDTVLYKSLRTATMATQQKDTLIIDSLSIAEGTFSINGIPNTAYELFPDKAALVWKTKPVPDSVTVRYRVLPFSFYKKYSHKKTTVIDSNYAFPIYTYSENDTNLGGFVNFNSIEYNGSYGRSLSIGNNQDVSLNSNFNLQLNGYILDSVHVEAALTDNNIPFQPEGNTQQIQEFDKLYIIFEKKTHKLTAGDFELTRPNSYFINFNKRVQGLYYQDTYPNNKNIQNKIGLSGSIAKGQFARNTFQGTEGNQGPYKLTGNNGEQFFIVLAGSERVYVDGMLLERGQNRDYIIDYNTGEITFMPRKMITKDSRIQVEFEYQDRNYLNSLLYAYDELQIGKQWNIRFNAYSNQDAKNQSYLQNFTADQKRLLENIGDSIGQAYSPNIVRDTFSANKILYKIIDTTVNNVHYDSVFVYSTNPDSAQYSVSFSNVGLNKGDYTISAYNSNGRSYIWVPPLNGVPQGDYAPISVLITPKKQQLFSVGATYQIDSLKQVSVEAAASNYDPNLFSKKDNNNHWGFAGRALYSEQRLFGNKDSTGRQKTKWQNTLSYEYVQAKFKPIAPYRDVEFSRDWNVDSTDSAKGNDEQLVLYSTELARQNLGKVHYEFAYYARGNYYKANRNILSLAYSRNTVRSEAVLNLMQSTAPLVSTRFFRPTFYVEKDFKKQLNITVGTRYEIQDNAIKDRGSDTLMLNAFSYDIISFYARNTEAHKVNVEASYSIRNDKAPHGDVFTPLTRSDNIDAKISLQRWKNHRLSFTGTYRKLRVYDSTRSAETPGATALGRLEYSGNIGKGFLQPTLMYEIGSGQEQKQQFTYVQVPAGQGVYYWVDYNGDGVQQSNEFEVAVYDDQKQYIRVITPTNEYVKTNYTNFNFALQLSPENLWDTKTQKGLRRFIARFSDQLSVQINNKTTAGNNFKSFNPFASGFADTQIIANAASWSNTVYFNRTSAAWGLDYTYLYVSGKTLLTYGIEGNEQVKNLLKSRWTLTHAFTANMELQEAKKGYQSGVADDNRTYDVTLYSFKPSLTWILKSKLRITGSYQYDNRKNAAADGGEEANIQSANMNMRLSFPNYGSIVATGTYSAIDYTGDANTSLSFVMLDALQKGNNWLWGLSWERRLGKGIELSLEYEGRAPGTSPVVHTGTMSIRAIL